MAFSATPPPTFTLVKPDTVAVLGCGWLGLPLARALIKAGHQVAGSTTSTEQVPLLVEAGIRPHVLRLGPHFGAPDEAVLQQLLEGANTLILNVPPRAAAAGTYPALLRPVHRAVAVAGVRQVLFVSSTSVYPDAPRLMHETDALSTRDAASDVLRAEGHFVPRYGQWLSTVVRLGGLIGPGRAPGRFLAGRREVPQGDAPVNLLHLTDAVGVLECILKSRVWGFTFNVCAADHPRRRDFYPQAARFLGLEPPIFAENSGNSKTIDSSLVRQKVPYPFKHDNLLEALAYC